MLFIKESLIPNAGQGLWTSREIKKDEIVCEYEGERLTWNQCNKRNEVDGALGAYFFYVSTKNCIDAENTLWSLGRYANDAVGFARVVGLRNNSKYEIRKGKPYIIATRNIQAGSEVLVSYGREYWLRMKEKIEAL